MSRSIIKQRLLLTHFPVGYPTGMVRHSHPLVQKDQGEALNRDKENCNRGRPILIFSQRNKGWAQIQGVIPMHSRNSKTSVGPTLKGVDCCELNHIYHGKWGVRYQITTAQHLSQGPDYDPWTCSTPPCHNWKTCKISSLTHNMVNQLLWGKGLETSLNNPKRKAVPTWEGLSYTRWLDTELVFIYLTASNNKDVFFCSLGDQRSEIENVVSPQAPWAISLYHLEVLGALACFGFELHNFNLPTLRLRFFASIGLSWNLGPTWV